MQSTTVSRMLNENKFETLAELFNETESTDKYNVFSKAILYLNQSTFNVKSKVLNSYRHQVYNLITYLLRNCSGVTITI